MTNESLFTEAVKKYSNSIYRFAYSWLKNSDDANDVTQDVLMALYLCDKSFESEEHLKNWLMKVTANQCKKIFRAPWSKREDIEEYANTLSFENEDYLDLFQAVMKLDKKYRIPFLLFALEGYSTREISEFLGIPEKTVSTRIGRAKEKLRIALKEV